MERYRIDALSKGLRVLEAVASEPGLPLKRISELCGMTLSQAFRMAATLELSGYVVSDDAKRYHLGFKCLRLGNAAELGVPLIHLARGEMDLLSRETRESISLVVRDKMERVTIDLRESPYSIRASAPIGERLPLHHGGTGPCLLAFSPDDIVAEALTPPLSRATAYTETDPEVVRRRLTRIRERGYHVALQDYADHAFSVAAPIVGPDGVAVGAISISGPLMRFDSERETRYVELVRQVAERLEAKLLA